MTERLADLSVRIDGIHQLGSVVNAMKGIAAARASAARGQVEVVDRFAETIAAAMSSVIDPEAAISAEHPDSEAGKIGLIVFCAEQGFAGAFSERVLDSLGKYSDTETVFLIGARGQSLMALRELTPVWFAAMPSHTSGIPKLANAIADEIYHRIDAGRVDRLDAVYTIWKSGRPEIVRRTLYPIDRSGFATKQTDQPLIQLPLEALVVSLSIDYLYALICKAALHAFAAENEARLEAMTAAGSQIAREIAVLQATLRRVRQEAITAEIIELSIGASAARDRR